MSPIVKNALTRDKLAYGIGPAVPTDRSVRSFLWNHWNQEQARSFIDY